MESFNKYLGKAFRITEDFRRHLISTVSLDKKIVNQHEIKVVSLRRSGTHAIINWILGHYDYEIGMAKDVAFFNNVTPKINFYRQLAKYHPKKLGDDAQGKFRERHVLCYNYENACLEDVTAPYFEFNHDIYFGKSQHKYDVLILRDPFNTMASIYQGLIEGKTIYSKVHLKRKNITQLWIDYAKEFLGETNHLKNKKVLINYNQWIIDKNYRKEISKQLNLDFTDQNLTKVPKQGGGSSFDGVKFNHNSQQMRLTERWKKFINHPEYRRMFNQEMIDYGEKIFSFTSPL
ncbi:MAG: hypothetical protein AB4063_06410 [Crocosphaera sp.]